MCQLYFDKTGRKKRKTEKISTKWWNMSFQPPSPPLPWKNCLWQPMWLKVTLENPGVQWKGSDIFRAKNLGINTLKKVTRTILLCLHHPSLKLYSRASRETLSALNSSHRESENLGSSWIPQLCGTQPERFIFFNLSPFRSFRRSACLKSGTARFRENVQGSQKPNSQ